MNSVVIQAWNEKLREMREKIPPIKAAVVILVLLGMALILWPSSSTSPSPAESETITSGPEITSDLLEKELAQSLSQIEGVGAVKTQLTLDSDGRRVYAVNEHHESRLTRENDKTGTTRDITEDTAELEMVLADNSPVLEESQMPEVLGVLVIAEGAADPTVEEDLIEAVTGLMGVPASRVTVLPMAKGGEINGY